MKYLIILIITSTCIGCAGTMSNYEGTGGPFFISRKSDHMGIQCYILSIRDSGVVLLPSSNNSLSAYNESDAFFYHRDSISTIVHNGLQGMNALGGLAGGFIGFWTGYGIREATYVAPPEPEWFDFHTAESVGLGLIGTFFGSLIGAWVFSPQSSFDLYSPADKEKLIYLCKYCGHEPDFINAIK